MKNLNNNKGFTLVELLISLAIISILMGQIAYILGQTSYLYLKGTNEVSLQTESQHLIQQLEELLIDCTGEVTVVSNNTISSDQIIIKSFEVENGVSTNKFMTYDIELHRDPADDFGSVSMSVIDDTGAHTDDIPMADYVQTISFNMGKFSTNSVIQINVTMKNNYYTYVASKDVYCRNDIGISGNASKPSNTSSYDYEINMLRYDKIYLKNFLVDNEIVDNATIAAGCTFTFVDTNTDYDYNSTNKTLECSSTLNGSWSDKIGPYILTVEDSSGSHVCDIGVLTDPVAVGVGAPGSTKGYGFGYCSAADQDYLSNYVPVFGVALAKSEKVSVSTKVYGPEDFKISGTSYSKYTKGGYESWGEQDSSFHISTDGKPANTGSNYIPEKDFSIGSDSYKFRSNKTFTWTDKISNSCVLSSQKLQNTTSSLAEMCKKGGAFLIRTTYKFPGSKTIEVNYVMIDNSYNDSDFNFTYNGGATPKTYTSYYTYVKDVVNPNN